MKRSPDQGRDGIGASETGKKRDKKTDDEREKPWRSNMKEGKKVMSLAGGVSKDPNPVTA